MSTDPDLPVVIDHDNMWPILKTIGELPCFQCGKHNAPRPEWIDQEVILEFPTGECCEDGLKTLALLGRRERQHSGLTGDEGFDAQGLEGKVLVRKDLFSALMNLRDLLQPGRGRILTRRT